MDIGQNSPADKPAPIVPAAQDQLAARLKAVRAEISFLHASAYAYGLNGPHRRRRDEYILQAFAADIHARMIEARAGQ